MRSGWIGVALLTLIAAPLAAGTSPAEAPAAPATLLGEAGSCSGPAAGSVAVSTGGVTAQGYCQADCDGLLISCWGDRCSAADRNCSVGERGYVECDGVWNFCHQGACETCPCGTCGETRWFQTQNCCSGNLFLWKHQECTTSGWVDTGPTDCLVACDGSGGV